MGVTLCEVCALASFPPCASRATCHAREHPNIGTVDVPTVTGLTVAHGLGYSPVCLTCPTPQRLRVVTRLRSACLDLLTEHHTTDHTAVPA